MPVNLKTIRPSPKCVNSGPYTVDAPGFEKVEGETVPRRNVHTKDGLKMRPTEELAVMSDIIRIAAAKFGNAKAIGSRTLVKTHNETKKLKRIVDGQEQEYDKKWTYFELSEYKYMSFVEFEQLCLQLGAGLRKLGLQAPDRVHLFAATRSVTTEQCHLTHDESS